MTVNVVNFTGLYILSDLIPSTQYNIYIKAAKYIGITHGILEGNSSLIITAKTLSSTSTSIAQGMYFYSPFY